MGLTDNALTLPVKDGHVDVASDMVQTEIQKLLAEGKTLARKRLIDQWPAVRLVVAGLLKKGHLTRSEFETFVSRGSSPSYRSSLRKAYQSVPKSELDSCLMKYL